MRVIQVNILSKNRSTGRTTDEFHNFLIKTGHESFVAYGIGSKDNSPNFYKISNKFDYYVHNVLDKIFGTQGFHSRLTTNKFVKWIDKIKPDVVHLRNLHSNYVNIEILLNYLAKKKIPTVITTHDFWFLTAFCSFPKEDCDILNSGDCKHYNNKLYNPKRVFNKKKRLFSSIDKLAIQANSNYSLSIVKKSYLKNNPAEVIYNWIDFDSFYPEPIKGLFNTDGKPIVLAIWSVLSEKIIKFKFFVEIAEKLNHKYQFVMVGSYSFDPQKYPFITFIRGTDDVSLLRKYYSSADVLFNPSINDSFGKVVAEAISCGTPCVVFNNRAFPELIGDNECGILTTPLNAGEAINAIELVIGRGKTFYSDKCVERSKKLFDMNTNCKKLLEMYKKLIKYEK